MKIATTYHHTEDTRALQEDALDAVIGGIGPAVVASPG
jgi:hypothetical protein